MSKTGTTMRAAIVLSAALAAAVAPGKAETGGSYRVLYAFTGGSDGGLPNSPLTADSRGNLYGTTEYGGNLDCDVGFGCGTVFRLSQAGKLSVVYTFGTGDGTGFGGLIRDGAGNLYGSTQDGGASGDGTVYEIAADGTHSVIYAFAGGKDGAAANGVIRDEAGNFYGTTYLGGGSGCGGEGCGTVFRLAPNGVETQLYAFKGTAEGDGYYPDGTLTIDRHGNLYGTTIVGGISTACSKRYSQGCGIIFRISPHGSETVLYAFQGTGDGAHPSSAPLARDGSGNLYGTTEGSTMRNGTVFKLAPGGTLTTMYTFARRQDGRIPAGIVRDAKGNLFGATAFGGAASDDGVLFRLGVDGTETTLHRFDGEDGRSPWLPSDENGVLYGAALYGGGAGICTGYGCGTIYAYTK